MIGGNAADYPKEVVQYLKVESGLRDPLIITPKVTLTTEDLLSKKEHSITLPPFKRKEIEVIEGNLGVFYHLKIYPYTPDWIKYLAFLSRRCIVMWGGDNEFAREELEFIGMNEVSGKLQTRRKIQRWARGVGYFIIPMIDERTFKFVYLPQYLKIQAKVLNYSMTLRPKLVITQTLFQDWTPPDENWTLLLEDAMEMYQKSPCKALEIVELLVTEMKLWLKWGKQIKQNIQRQNCNVQEALRTVQYPWQLAGVLYSLWNTIEGVDFDDKIKSLKSLWVINPLLENEFFLLCSRLILKQEKILQE